MRIAFAIGESVMLSVAGHPLLGHDGGGEPKPKPHRKSGEVVKSHAAMCLRSMQEKRHTHVGHVAGDEDENNRHPPSSRQFTEPWHPKLHVLVELESSHSTAAATARPQVRARNEQQPVGASAGLRANDREI